MSMIMSNGHYQLHTSTHTDRNGLLFPRAVLNGSIGWVLDNEGGELVTSVYDVEVATRPAALLDLAFGSLDMLQRKQKS